MSVIFICMDRKNKAISIRLSENQLRSLCEAILLEKKNKSELIRDIIQEYSQKNCRKQDLLEKLEKQTNVKDPIHPAHKKLKLMNLK
jgi:metal-responsive CopG/Arc/MetJ family transcriptional regulator